MSSTIPTAQDIAAELREAAASSPAAMSSAISARFAEKVEVAHEPALPLDGVIDRDFLIQSGTAEIAAFQRAMSDFKYEGEVSTDGDDVLALMTMSGTASDGTAIAVTVPTTYTIKDGEIARIKAEVDADTVTTLTKVLTSAGFEIPQE